MNANTIQSRLARLVAAMLTTTVALGIAASPALVTATAPTPTSANIV